MWKVIVAALVRTWMDVGLDKIVVVRMLVVVIVVVVYTITWWVMTA